MSLYRKSLFYPKLPATSDLNVRQRLSTPITQAIYLKCSAIDNVTRGLIGMGQLPVTCGLFFSLGHSTIVIVVVCAKSTFDAVRILISSTEYCNCDLIRCLQQVGRRRNCWRNCRSASDLHNLSQISPHQIPGASVSGVFLFIVAVANSVVLWRILRRRRLVSDRWFYVTCD